MKGAADRWIWPKLFSDLDFNNNFCGSNKSDGFGFWQKLSVDYIIVAGNQTIHYFSD